MSRVPLSSVSYTRASPLAACRFRLYPTKKKNLAVLRVRYTASLQGPPLADALSGVVSLNRVAPSLYEFHVVGPPQVRAGGAYTVQIRALHPLTGVALGGVKLSAKLSAVISTRADDLSLAAQQLTTNAQGFATLSFIAPSNPNLTSVDLDILGNQAGIPRIKPARALRSEVTSSCKSPQTSHFYQPGQTVHTRMLLLDANGRAFARQPVTLDVVKVLTPHSSSARRLSPRASASRLWTGPFPRASVSVNIH